MPRALISPLHGVPGGPVEGVVGDLRDADPGDSGRVAAQFVDISLHAGPSAGDHAVTAVGVALDPVLPTEGGHPQPVDEDDGVGVVPVRVVGCPRFLLRLLLDYVAACAAWSISWAISAGRETADAWLAGREIVVAPMRCARKACS